MSSTLASMAGTLSIVLLVAGVVLMLTIHIAVVYWALRRGWGTRDSRVEEGGGGGGVRGLSADELGKLPCYDFRAAAAGGGGDCAVCLEVFQVGDRCRVLPRCEHSFHAQCVDSWLRKSLLCPICRAEVVGHGKAAGAATEATLEIVAEREAAVRSY